MELTEEHICTLKYTPLRVYSLLMKRKEALQVKDLAALLGVTQRAVYNALTDLKNRSLVVKQGSLYCIKIHKSEEKVKDKERSKEKENSSNNNLSSLDLPVVNENILFTWLAEDAGKMEKWCKVNGIQVMYPVDKEKLVAALMPHFEMFKGWLAKCGQTPESKGREDCIKHFESWLPKNMIRLQYQRNGGAGGGCGGAQGMKPASRVFSSSLTPEQQDEQMLQKQRRMEKSEELQAQLDEQAKAAQTVEAKAVKEKFFAKFGWK